MFSPKDIYRLNPPHNLRPSDWVIDLPRPEPHVEVSSLAIARKQHQSVRIQQLVEYVDKRFCVGRCFYKFLAENRGKGPSSGQFVVTGIFAYHEIEHWPGAYPHLQWTKFVMENMEYDALAEVRASEEGLILPTLPIEALPMFTTLKQIEGDRLAKESAMTGKSIRELTAYEFERHQLETQGLDALAAPPTPGLLQPASGAPDHLGEPSPAYGITNNPVHQFNIHRPEAPPSHEHHIPQALSEFSPFQSNPSPHLLLPFNGRLYYRHVHEASQNYQLFLTICEAHAVWTTRQVKNQHRLMLRIIFASPESASDSWHYCYYLARQAIHDFADQAFQTWRLHNPGVPFDENKHFPNWLRKQYEYLLATIQAKDPIPTNLPVQLTRTLTMKQMLVTMVRQQAVLVNWTVEMRARAGERDGNRYRFELDNVLDLWTGEVYTVEEFSTRERKEKVLGSPYSDLAQRTAAAAMAGMTMQTG